MLCNTYKFDVNIACGGYRMHGYTGTVSSLSNPAAHILLTEILCKNNNTQNKLNNEWKNYANK